LVLHNCIKNAVLIGLSVSVQQCSSRLILHAIPAGQKLGNFSPSIAHLLMQLEYHSIFHLSPRRFLDIWVEMVVPSAHSQSHYPAASL